MKAKKKKKKKQNWWQMPSLPRVSTVTTEIVPYGGTPSTLSVQFSSFIPCIVRCYSKFLALFLSQLIYTRFPNTWPSSFHSPALKHTSPFILFLTLSPP